MRKQSRKEKGFTLVEVLASLVILSIILVGVLNLFVFTNKAAVTNNDRLVAINLGKATLERVKNAPEDYFSSLTHEALENGVQLPMDDCESEECKDLYTELINDKEYEIMLDVSQDESERNMQLINVLVTVELPEEDISHQVEGYVVYGQREEIEE